MVGGRFDRRTPSTVSAASDHDSYLQVAGCAKVKIDPSESSNQTPMSSLGNAYAGLITSRF